MKGKNTNIWSVLRLSIKISLESSFMFSMIRIFCTLLNSVIPTLKLFIMKLIIDYLFLKMRSETFFFVIIYIVILMINMAIDKMNNYISRMHGEKISFQVSKTIINKVRELDISYYDNPKLYDEMSIITNNGGAISNLFWSMVSLSQGILQLIISFIIISKIGMVYAIILVLSSLPYYFVERKNEIDTYLWNRENENKKRKINYLYRVLIEKYYSIDIRVNNSSTYMQEKYCSNWNAWFNLKNNFVRWQFIKSFFSILLSNIVASVFLLIMTYNVLFKEMSVSDFTYYLGVSTQLISYTYFVLSVFSSFKQLKMKTESYYDFLGWKSKVSYKKSENSNYKKFISLKFEHVSFTYPNCREQILKDISFEIKAGEKVLLIGNNGSGKSTLIKLILRLYEPTEGKIFINGKLISEYSQSEYYKIFSYLPQNFINYAFTIKENIFCADPDLNDGMRVFQCLKKANLLKRVNELPNDIDTYISKQFDLEGVELSGGEWQKLALARFFYRDAEINILDEPSSSLDVFSQDNILANMLDDSVDKTVLLISHRLVSLDKINRIISLVNGSIIENNMPEVLDKEDGFFAKWKEKITK